MDLGAPIASGRDADLFPLGDERVLRRYRAGGDVAVEADVMRHLAEHDYPVPVVYESSGTDMTIERLVGPTTGNSFERRTIAEARRLLRRLQRAPRPDRPRVAGR